MEIITAIVLVVVLIGLGRHYVNKDIIGTDKNVRDLLERTNKTARIVKELIRKLSNDKEIDIDDGCVFGTRINHYVVSVDDFNDIFDELDAIKKHLNIETEEVVVEADKYLKVIKTK